MILTYQPRWTCARAAVIAREILRRGLAFESLVDMGAYEGDMAALVTRWTADLRRDGRGVPWAARTRCEEGRPINLEIGRFKYPHVEWAAVDYETCDLEALPAADVVLCCGLLYHFTHTGRAAAVLRAAITRARHLLVIDSEISDTFEGEWVAASAGRHDHGIHADGAQEFAPSAPWVEAILTAAGVGHVRFDTDDLADGDGHQRYAWEATGLGGYARGQRRFWMMWK